MDGKTEEQKAQEEKAAAGALSRFMAAKTIGAKAKEEYARLNEKLQGLLDAQMEGVFDAARMREIDVIEARLEELLEEHRKAVLPGRKQILAELARRELKRRSAASSLLDFAEYVRPEYRANWHHKRLAAKLQDWIEGTTPFLIVCMPPRHGKSELVSRLLPAYIHGLNPQANIICATHTAGFAKDLCGDVQSVMDSAAYKRIFSSRIFSPGARVSAGKQVTLRTATEHKIVGHSGRYLACGVGNAIVGKGFDFGIVDDPIKGWEAARSPAQRAALWGWWTSEFLTRRSHDGRIVVTVTRWHEADLVGLLLDDAGIDWEVISWPAIKDGPFTLEDPRLPGQPLWADRFDAEYFKPFKANPATWSALFQQRPVEEGGEIFLQQWMQRRWTVEPAGFDRVVISVDATFKKTRSGSFVAMQVWGALNDSFYLLDEVRERLSFVETKRKLLQLCAKWPEKSAVLIEEAANGAAIIDALTKGAGHERVAGVVPIKTRGQSKEVRAEAVTPLFAAGNVVLPSSKAQARNGPASWVSDFVSELVTFPAGRYNDRVDAAAQALNYLATRRRSYKLGRV